MPRDDAQKRVADKIADACGDPDEPNGLQTGRPSDCGQWR